MSNEILLAKDEYNPYYSQYIKKATHKNIITGLKQNMGSVIAFYNSISPDKLNFAYKPGKWTIKDILLHVVDTERIFNYRALRISRNDQTPLVGFYQDEFVNSANASSRSIESIVKEYKSVRKSTLSMFESFHLEDYKKIGVASGSQISVRAIGYILTGHENHHLEIIKERYL